MHDIRDGDLRFRSEEASAMLEAQGVRLTHTQLNRLHSLTEGWAAGARARGGVVADRPRRLDGSITPLRR